LLKTCNSCDTTTQAVVVCFCVNGSKDCLVEAKVYLASRWKSCMLSHWFADCH